MSGDVHVEGPIGSFLEALVLTIVGLAFAVILWQAVLIAWERWKGRL